MLNLAVASESLMELQNMTRLVYEVMTVGQNVNKMADAVFRIDVLTIYCCFAVL